MDILISKWIARRPHRLAGVLDRTKAEETFSGSNYLIRSIIIHIQWKRSWAA